MWNNHVVSVGLSNFLSKKGEEEGGVFSGVRMRESGCQKRLVFFMSCKVLTIHGALKKMRSCPL
jgi:hypothetical protein